MDCYLAPWACARMSCVSGAAIIWCNQVSLIIIISLVSIDIANIG